MEELWKIDQRLKLLREEWDNGRAKQSTDDYKEFARDGTQWFPLIQERVGAACSLEVLFLRREPRGGVIQSGDLDNRIKTLFDCLRPPHENEIPDGFQPSSEPNPFFCLLSDDRLIAEFRVTSDRLLIPAQNRSQESDVHLIIQVRTSIVDHIKAQWFVLAGILR